MGKAGKQRREGEEASTETVRKCLRRPKSPLIFYSFIYLFNFICLILTLSWFKLRLAARSPSRCPSPWPPAPSSPAPDHIVTGLDPHPRAKRNRGRSTGTSSPTPSACFRLVLLPTRPRAPPNSRPYTEWGYQICPLISFHHISIGAPISRSSFGPGLADS
jgi:hypothetical protein